jgi:Kef-type K+ transport system membrane component KefB
MCFIEMLGIIILFFYIGYGNNSLAELRKNPRVCFGIFLMVWFFRKISLTYGTYCECILGR